MQASGWFLPILRGQLLDLVLVLGRHLYFLKAKLVLQLFLFGCHLLVEVFSHERFQLPLFVAPIILRAGLAFALATASLLFAVRFINLWLVLVFPILISFFGHAAQLQVQGLRSTYKKTVWGPLRAPSLPGGVEGQSSRRLR